MKLSSITLLGLTALLLLTVLAGQAGAAPVIGSSADERLQGTPNADVMLGLAGNDWLTGRAGDDVLYGDGACPPGAKDPSYCSTGDGPRDGSDLLDGSEGDDRLYGQGGDDLLVGGPGRDIIDAGPGQDVIVARDGERDTIRCGDGIDLVIADREDIVAPDCETVLRPRARGGGGGRERGN